MISDNFFEDFNPTFDFGIDFMLCESNEPEGNQQIVTVDDDIDQFLSGSKSKSTAYKDTSGCKRLQIFMREIDPTETRDFLDLSKKDLDQLMCLFFMKAKKIDKKSLDELYQPDTLNAFRNAWQRVIFDKGLKFNTKTDAEFERSRKVLSSRRKQLTQLGMGNKPNATMPLEDVEVEKLYQSGYFGSSTPEALHRTVWWSTGLEMNRLNCDMAISKFARIVMVMNI